MNKVIIILDEKIALIFHKNFLLTRRNPLEQRVSLCMNRGCVMYIAALLPYFSI